MQNQPITCSFAGCGKPNSSYGLCQSHAAQRRRGKALFPLHSKKRPDHTPPRIEYKQATCPVLILIGPCHVFSGAIGSHGYGMIWTQKKKLALVHRYVWELERGPIPPGLHLDHVCGVRACCNAGHLRVVTPRENSLENSSGAGAVNKMKTHCHNGHCYSAENTYRFQCSPGNRVCRTCALDRARKNRAARIKKGAV